MRRSLALFLCGATAWGCSTYTLADPQTLTAARAYGPNGSKSVTVAIGDTVQLRSFAYFASGDSNAVIPWDVNWQSRRPLVAVLVDQSGMIRGTSSGTATVVLTIATRFTDSLTVVVR